MCLSRETFLFLSVVVYMPLKGFLGDSGLKNSPANVGDTGSIPGSGGSPAEGNGNPLQYSCWEIPWAEEPGGLQPMESQRVRHNFVTNEHTIKNGIQSFKLSPGFCKWLPLDLLADVRN